MKKIHFEMKISKMIFKECLVCRFFSKYVFFFQFGLPQNNQNVEISCKIEILHFNQPFLGLHLSRIKMRLEGA